LRSLLAAFNDRDWDRFEACMERHLAPTFELRFPRGEIDPIPRRRYRHRTVQATRLYDGLHEEVLATTEGDDLLSARIRRIWNGVGGPVEVDVHVVFEHGEGPEGRWLLTAWEVLGPERPARDQP
jgi:hypothetical protein